jgi:hypothetical protein
MCSRINLAADHLYVETTRNGSLNPQDPGALHNFATRSITRYEPTRGPLICLCDHARCNMSLFSLVFQVRKSA